MSFYAGIIGHKYGGMPPADAETEAVPLCSSTIRGDGPFPVVLNGDGCWRYFRDGVVEQVVGRGNIAASFNRTVMAADNKDIYRSTGLYRLFSDAELGALTAWA